MTHLEHEGLGVSFDLPEIRQRDAEALLEAERSIRRKREGNRQDVIDETAEEVRAAILIAQRGKFRPASTELAALANRAAEGIVRRISNTPLDELAAQETYGIWCKAAARLEWLGDITEEQVGDMSPAAVRWLAVQLVNTLTEASTVPNA